MTQTPFQNGETPFGRLYEPQHGFVQFLTFCLAFFGGPGVGMVVGASLGGLSESAQIALYVPFVATFFLGYGLWISRLNMLAFNLIGRGLFKALFYLLILRRKPKNAEDILPSEAKLVEAAVKAQKAGWSFFMMSIPVAGFSMLGALLIDAQTSAVERAFIVGSACLLWGYALGWLGRHGYLPFMEEG